MGRSQKFFLNIILSSTVTVMWQHTVTSELFFTEKYTTERASACVKT